MPVAVKFCGLTRPADAAMASELGAQYVGGIFAESPRRITIERAREVYAAAVSGETAPVRVAVFGDATPEELAETARGAGAAVVQLHSDPEAEVVNRVRRWFDGGIWAVVRIGERFSPDSALIEAADAIVLDTRGAGTLGGTGIPFDWEIAANALSGLPRATKLVLAGGLRPSNVGDAIRVLRPDVVDVSSGVESSPGIKDHALMRAFVEAVAGSDPR